MATDHQVRTCSTFLLMRKTVALFTLGLAALRLVACAGPDTADVSEIESAASGYQTDNERPLATLPASAQTTTETNVVSWEVYERPEGRVARGLDAERAVLMEARVESSSPDLETEPVLYALAPSPALVVLGLEGCVLHAESDQLRKVGEAFYRDAQGSADFPNTLSDAEGSSVAELVQTFSVAIPGQSGPDLSLPPCVAVCQQAWVDCLNACSVWEWLIGKCVPKCRIEWAGCLAVTCR